MHRQPHALPTEMEEDEAELLRMIRSRSPLRQLNDPDVHAAVERYAGCARRLGLPPEQLLVALKQLLRTRALHDVGDWYRTVLSDRIIVWAIEGFYRMDCASAEHFEGEDS
ncbi:MAG TPA: hypothetical protein VFK13_06055 [Gemmatimonadaceae bacterium]|nr:hypothetical protein [Gemmatimonadaceae bacterium]